MYQLGPLQCTGKAPYAVYPSEMYEHRISSIEYDVDQLEYITTQNSNEISSLKSRTTKLETDAAAPDYYFKMGTEA